MNNVFANFNKNSNIIRVKRIGLVMVFLTCSMLSAFSQEKEEADSNNQYIEDLTGLLNLRLYTLTKYNTLEVINPDGRINMRPNGNTNLGIGFNYKSFRSK